MKPPVYAKDYENEKYPWAEHIAIKIKQYQDELEETTTVYITAADGKTVEVHACNSGRVTICSSGFDGSPADDPHCCWINNGCLSTFTEREWTDTQKRYMELEDRLNFGGDEYNMTEEKKQQAWDFIEHGQNRQIIEKDQYGQSLCEIHLDCDEVLDYITFEYTYAEGKEEL